MKDEDSQDGSPVLLYHKHSEAMHVSQIVLIKRALCWCYPILVSLALALTTHRSNAEAAKTPYRSGFDPARLCDTQSAGTFQRVLIDAVRTIKLRVYHELSGSKIILTRDALQAASALPYDLTDYWESSRYFFIRDEQRRELYLIVSTEMGRIRSPVYWMFLYDRKAAAGSKFLLQVGEEASGPYQIQFVATPSATYVIQSATGELGTYLSVYDLLAGRRLCSTMKNRM